MGQVGPELRRVRREAADDALADAGIGWSDVQFVAGGETVRNGYAGYVAGASIAQVCELTWQLQGRADGRQVVGARVGVTANQGLFGHDSSVVLST